MIDPYSRITTIDMWTDDYISKQMLKYHIDGGNDIASRNSETISKTCEFITSMLGKSKTICDYGCGPGLYTDLLQKQGHEVIGVDVSKTSLDYARSKNKNVMYFNMNYITHIINTKVDLAMMIYCDFGALDPKSQVKVLSNIKSTLKDDGLFFFDVASDNYYNNVEEDYKKYKETDGFFMEGVCNITSETVKYPNLNLVLRYDHAVGKKEFHLYNWDKCYTVDEMKVLLKDNGFEIVDYYSNTYGDKDYKNSYTIAFLCKKK